MAQFDPYAPPAVDEPGPTQPGFGGPLYTEQQVTLATFFGTPMAGFVLLALNEGRLGRPEGKLKTLVLGGVATFAFLLLVIVMPDSVPGAVVSLPALLGMQQLARHWQGAEVTERLAQGVTKGSGWVAFGVGVAGLVGAVLVGGTLGFLFPELFV